MTTTNDSLARIAYRAYGEATGNRNYQGQPMPAWEDLGETIQQAWIAAAEQVRREVESKRQAAVVGAYEQGAKDVLAGRLNGGQS